ncbi:hypothetical protein BDQ17DRAFT_1424084 [Cyathus striatus]|nr:hypothetical protein BDQ17DRAFT_1424084 [Cyathus striatus]
MILVLSGFLSRDSGTLAPGSYLPFLSIPSEPKSAQDLAPSQSPDSFRRPDLRAPSATVSASLLPPICFRPIEISPSLNRRIPFRCHVLCPHLSLSPDIPHRPSLFSFWLSPPPSPFSPVGPVSIWYLERPSLTPRSSDVRGAPSPLPPYRLTAFAGPPFAHVVSLAVSPAAAPCPPSR